jgi:GH43 family beta-xylosidase
LALSDRAWHVHGPPTYGHRLRFALRSAGRSPLSRWHDTGAIKGLGESWAIDGTRLDVAVNWYFVWSGHPRADDGVQDLFIARMRSAVGVIGPRHLLSTPSQGWERHGAPIDEGPEQLSHGDTTMVVYSASGSWTNKYCYGLLTYRGGGPCHATHGASRRNLCSPAPTAY